MTAGTYEPDPLAVHVVASLTSAGSTVAVAESLTGGLVLAALTSVAGASVVVRGGVVAYATDLKAGLLDVPTDLLGEVGAVHPDVAAAMARGVARRCAAGYGVATTGVAGPDPQDGRPVGEVHLAVALPDGALLAQSLELGTVGREAVRRATVVGALRLLAAALV